MLESYFPVVDAQGEVICAGTAVVDITDRKQAEEVLGMANAELARAARLKDEFLASMSHELRTPLNGILTLTQSLSEQVYGSMTPQQLDVVHDVEECGLLLLSLINDILDVAKVEAGKIELELGSHESSSFARRRFALSRKRL